MQRIVFSLFVVFAMFNSVQAQADDRVSPSQIPHLGKPVHLEVMRPGISENVSVVDTQGLQVIQGPAGPRGDNGEKGDRGPRGKNGSDGEKGIQGLQGATGAQGIQGLTGANGTNGTNGIDGAQGLQGLQGATGAQGIQGLTGASTQFTISGDSGVDQTISNGTALELNGGSGMAVTTTTNTVLFTLSNLSDNWTQSGPYDFILNNASSEISLLESAGGNYYGIFDVGDLSSDALFTFSGLSGTVLTTANYTSTLDSAYLRRDNNLSDLVSASSARTNLGLGTVSLQNTDNVSLTGGTINGVAIGESTPAAGTFTGIIATASLGSPHLNGTGNEPGIAVGVGAGTGASASLDGTDVAGVITLTTGTLPSASSTASTVTFNTAFNTAPYVTISPANQATALLNGATMAYVSSTATTFMLTSGTVGLTGSTTYKWNYHVIQ